MKFFQIIATFTISLLGLMVRSLSGLFAVCSDLDDSGSMTFATRTKHLGEINISQSGPRASLLSLLVNRVYFCRSRPATRP